MGMAGAKAGPEVGRLPAHRRSVDHVFGTLLAVAIVSRQSFLPHQTEALAYAHRRKAIGLFLEMRLGKTPVTIRWMRQQKRPKKVLLIAPLDVLPGMQWEAEIKREGEWPVYMWPSEKPGIWLPAAEHNTAGWYGVNYEAVRSRPEILDFSWDCIVLDESTKIRNPKAQITKLLLNNTSHIRYRAILSGLPNPESPLDLFCQMKFLHGSFLGYDNFWAFRQAKFTQVGYRWIPRRGVINEIKEEIHRSCFIRSQKQVGMKNRMVFERRYCFMEPAQKRLQKEIETDFTAGESSTKWAPVQHLWLSRLAGGFSPTKMLISDSKLRLLKRVITEEFPKRRMVIWFRFNNEISVARDLLRDAGVKLAVIRGKTPKWKRPKIQKDFHRGKYRILLMQEKVGQFGLNLSCASIAVYFSNVWDQEVRAQSQQRIAHMMKKVPLLFLDLVTQGSIDEAVLDALQDKKRESRRFLRAVMSTWIEQLRKAA